MDDWMVIAAAAVPAFVVTLTWLRTRAGRSTGKGSTR